MGAALLLGTNPILFKWSGNIVLVGAI